MQTNLMEVAVKLFGGCIRMNIVKITQLKSCENIGCLVSNCFGARNSENVTHILRRVLKGDIEKLVWAHNCERIDS